MLQISKTLNRIPYALSSLDNCGLCQAVAQLEDRPERFQKLVELQFQACFVSTTATSGVVRFYYWFTTQNSKNKLRFLELARSVSDLSLKMTKRNPTPSQHSKLPGTIQHPKNCTDSEVARKCLL